MDTTAKALVTITQAYRVVEIHRTGCADLAKKTAGFDYEYTFETVADAIDWYNADDEDMPMDFHAEGHRVFPCAKGL